MSIVLDLLISTYTSTQSLFFLNVLNQKNIFYIVAMGLIIDFIIANTFGIMTLLLLFLYCINLKMSNYLLRNLFNYFFVIIILKFNFSFFGLILQIVFIYLVKNHIIKW
ncbi:MAG: hypothetical protein IJO63_02510 [Bacilli bacterium]|nr:hypothetical protein [Bacilli bacterium]